MKRDSKPWARALAGSLAVVMAFVFATPPAVASELAVKAPAETAAAPQAVTPAPSQTETPAIAAAVAAKVEAMDAAEAAEMAPVQDAVAATSEGAGSFLKSPKGIAAVVLTVAGIAFAVYKRGDDRIQSPVR